MLFDLDYAPVQKPVMLTQLWKARKYSANPRPFSSITGWTRAKSHRHILGTNRLTRLPVLPDLVALGGGPFGEDGKPDLTHYGQEEGLKNRVSAFSALLCFHECRISIILDLGINYDFAYLKKIPKFYVVNFWGVLLAPYTVQQMIRRIKGPSRRNTGTPHCKKLGVYGKGSTEKQRRVLLFLLCVSWS